VIAIRAGVARRASARGERLANAAAVRAPRANETAGAWKPAQARAGIALAHQVGACAGRHCLTIAAHQVTRAPEDRACAEIALRAFRTVHDARDRFAAHRERIAKCSRLAAGGAARLAELADLSARSTLSRASLAVRAGTLASVRAPHPRGSRAAVQAGGECRNGDIAARHLADGGNAATNHLQSSIRTRTKVILGAEIGVTEALEAGAQAAVDPPLALGCDRVAARAFERVRSPRRSF